MRLLFALALAVGLIQPAWSGERTLKVVSFNLWGLKGILLKKPGRIPKIVKAVRESGADVIAFQEAFNPKTHVLADLPEYPYVVWGAGKSFGKFQESGLLIISKYPIVATDRLTYRSCDFPNCFEPKGAVFARVRVPEVGEVDVFDTHLAATNNDSVRSGQVNELGIWIYGLTGLSRPTVVMGDFNSKPNSGAYDTIVRFYGFRDTHDEHVADHPELSAQERLGYTWDPARNPNPRMPFPFSNQSKRIDHILVQSVAMADIRVMNKRLVFHQPVDGLFLSDHFGIETDLLIRN